MDMIIELLIEMVFQFIAEIIGETLTIGADKASSKKFKLKNHILIYALYGILGFTIGMFSVNIYGPFIESQVLKIINIAFTPVLIGIAMHNLGKLKQVKNKKVLYLDKFLGGYLFALSFAIGRYIFSSPTN